MEAHGGRGWGSEPGGVEAEACCEGLLLQTLWIQPNLSPLTGVPCQMHFTRRRGG